MTGEISLLPQDFKVLVDAPMDGVAEEWCWVPVAFAPTEEDAIALARREKVVDDDLTVIAQDREWWRRDPAYKPNAYGQWLNAKEDVTTDFEPWLPCSKYAKTGIECWRLELSE